MNDLQKSQIHQECKIAMPEGLRDLMSDISREVLRAQPKNLYGFIANYLQALLMTRNELKVASSLCTGVCEEACRTLLEDDLRTVGLTDEDIAKILEIVSKFMKKDCADEGILLQHIINNTDIQEEQVEGVATALRNAFMRRYVQEKSVLELKSGHDKEVVNAVTHTIAHYDDMEEEEQLCQSLAALQIQSAYKKYDVRKKTSQISSKSLPELKSAKQEVSLKIIRFGSPEDNDKDEDSIESSVPSASFPSNRRTSGISNRSSNEKHVVISLDDIPVHIIEKDDDNDLDDDAADSVVPESEKSDSPRFSPPQSSDESGANRSFSLKAVKSESLKEMVLLKHSLESIRSDGRISKNLSKQY